ncbi:MAG: hypothetical protein H0T84_13275 [Tatlockia sp.]|nr:hypothetical protein [Tatlockia sp.]
MLTRYQYPEIIRANAYFEQGHETYAIPLYASRVSAGYPTSADDYIAHAIFFN